MAFHLSNHDHGTRGGIQCWIVIGAGQKIGPSLFKRDASGQGYRRRLVLTFLHSEAHHTDSMFLSCASFLDGGKHLFRFSVFTCTPSSSISLPLQCQYLSLFFIASSSA